jgi:hypothetical protein
MKNFFVHSITLVMLSLFVFSCGRAPSNVLSGVKVETTTVNDDIWMSFAADLNLGAMNFASLAVPILHPRGQTPIGQLELISGLGGANQIKVSVNVSELSDVQTSQALLPNGNMIPLIANNQTIAVNIGKGAKIYLTLSQNVTAIGVAIPISAFDSIGSKLPGLNIFPIVNSGDVIGTAGIFTGANAGQNGIAVVADVSRVVNLGSLFPARMSIMALSAEEPSDLVKLDYSSHSPSRSEKASFDWMIYKLNKKKALLSMDQ